MSVIRFFGGLMIVAGALVMALSGACTVLFALIGFGKMFQFIVFGGIPMLAGLLLFTLGRWMTGLGRDSEFFDAGFSDRVKIERDPAQAGSDDPAQGEPK